MSTNTANSTQSLTGFPIALTDDALEAIRQLVRAEVKAIRDDLRKEDWLTTEEAAAYLKTPISSIRKLTAADAIPFAQDCPGGRCHFLRSQLDRWRMERAQGPWK